MGLIFKSTKEIMTDIAELSNIISDNSDIYSIDRIGNMCEKYYNMELVQIIFSTNHTNKLEGVLLREKEILEKILIFYIDVKGLKPSESYDRMNHAKEYFDKNKLDRWTYYYIPYTENKVECVAGDVDNVKLQELLSSMKNIEKEFFIPVVPSKDREKLYEGVDKPSSADG